MSPTAETPGGNNKAKTWLFLYFVLGYFMIFVFPPAVFMVYTAFLAYKTVDFKSRHSAASLLTAERFEFKARHVLIFIFSLYIFFFTYTTKTGFFFFFMIPLGYFFNRTRFLALCILFYLFLVFVEDFKGKTGAALRRAMNSLPGKCAAVWLIGMLCVLSTLHGNASLRCPSEKSLIVYQEVLAQNFCSGNFMAREACRHDLGAIHGAAVDGKQKNFYFTHMGKGSESPLCMYSPGRKMRHKIMPYAASAQRLLYARKYNAVILPLMSEPKVLVVDASSLKVKQSFSTGASALVDAVLDEKKDILYVLSENATVYKIHLPSGKIKSFSFRREAGANTFALALDEKTQTLYATSWIGGMLSKIDAGNLKLLDVKRFLPSLMGIAVNEDENEIYAARPFPPAILVLDAGTLQKKKTLSTDFGTRAVAYISDRKLLAAGNYFAGTMQFFDMITGAEAFRFNAGGILRGITYDDVSHSIFSFSGCGIYEFPLSKIYPQQLPVH